MQKVITTKLNDDFAYYEYSDVANPKGIIQIVHGMTEHIGRYQHFIDFLNRQGYIVVGIDILGHGLTVDRFWMKKNGSRNYQERRGYFGKNAFRRINVGITRAYEEIEEKFPKLDKILIGHSLGALIARDYLVLNEGNIKKVTLIGLAEPNKVTLKFGLLATGALNQLKGGEATSKLLYNLTTGHYEKRFKKDGKAGWLSENKLSNDQYLNDEKTQFKFTNNAYKEMMKGIDYFSGVRNLNYQGPIFLLSGSEDPVTNFGKMVNKSKEYFSKKLKIKVDARIYTPMRHEILNEIKREIVYNDIINFIEEK